MLTRAEVFYRAVFLLFLIGVLLMDLLVWRPN
jgi:hypothetical protein